MIKKYQEEFMRKNNDLEYSAVKFDFSSDYGLVS